VINEVEPSEILIVNRVDRSATRLGDPEGLQQVIEALGSSFNLQLTRLVRAKRVLFVEGQDAKLLTRFARAAGYRDLFAIEKLTLMPLGGFAEYRRVVHARWTTDEMLGEEIKMMALFDRDYRSDEEVAAFEEEMRQLRTVAHVFTRKELENYVLVAGPLKRAIEARLAARLEHGKLNVKPDIDIDVILREVTDPMKPEVYGNYAAAILRYSQGRTDASTLLAQHSVSFELTWSDLGRRLECVPGKRTFAALNDRLRKDWGVSVSAGQVASLMRDDEVPKDMVEFLEKLKSHLYGP
jgi:hypothetical protein